MWQWTWNARPYRFTGGEGKQIKHTRMAVEWCKLDNPWDRYRQPWMSVTTIRHVKYVISNRFSMATATARQILGTHGCPIAPNSRDRNSLQSAKTEVILTPRHPWHGSIYWMEQCALALSQAQVTGGGGSNVRSSEQAITGRICPRSRQTCGGSILSFFCISMYTKSGALIVQGNLSARRTSIIFLHIRANRHVTCLGKCELWQILWITSSITSENNS